MKSKRKTVCNVLYFWHVHRCFLDKLLYPSRIYEQLVWATARAEALKMSCIRPSSDLGRMRKRELQ